MTKRISSLEEKQNKLNLKLDGYFSKNAGILDELPKDIYVIPVSDSDSLLFKYSVRLFERAKEEGRSNVLLAINFGNNWRFLNSI